MISCPLVVDLDGTLIHTDMLHETVLKALRDRPARLLRLPFWLLRGKVEVKRQLARHGGVDVAVLPYDAVFVDWLRQQRATGRRLILCTGSDAGIAQAIADHLGLFDEVLASQGTLNLVGDAKARLLEERFGRGGFDYAGNAQADLAVWRRARRAIVVSARSAVARAAGGLCPVERAFPRAPAGVAVWRRVLRVHHWLKNALLFVPLCAAHHFTPGGPWLTLALALLSFSLCASSVYVANDLLDLESDRLHRTKLCRPFASGAVPIWAGALLAPLLLLASGGLAWAIDGPFLSWLGVYFLAASAYSWRLKRVALVDCVTLAMLWTLRVVAGGAAVGVTVSFWLLGFSAFLFLSLAFVKRYAELAALAPGGRRRVHGRGYVASDAPLIQSLGVASGYASVVVLALYLNGDAVIRLYRQPGFLFSAVPITAFWISWMWMQAHRGQMHDDPLVFAIRDRASLLAAAGLLVAVVLGVVGWPPASWPAVAWPW